MVHEESEKIGVAFSEICTGWSVRFGCFQFPEWCFWYGQSGLGGSHSVLFLWRILSWRNVPTAVPFGSLDEFLSAPTNAQRSRDLVLSTARMTWKERENTMRCNKRRDAFHGISLFIS